MNVVPGDEAARVRKVYAERAKRGLEARYEYWRPANLFTFQTRERDLLRLLDRTELLPLSGCRVLDAGCGDGSVLRDLMRFGADPADLLGFDLLPDRIDRARELLPGARLEVGDARSLPVPDGSIDLVLAFTLLSTVLDDSVRGEIAAEMLRVARPGGYIVLYDFWINPFNRQARPVKREDVRRLFPGRAVSFRPTTLAPPLVRALAPRPGGWLVCSLLEVIPLLKTHFLAAVRV